MIESVAKADRPIRQAALRTPLLTRRLRQAMRVLWWSATLQLPSRLRARRQAQAGLRALPVPLAPALVNTPLDAAAIIIASHPQPLVSVIIPTYGQVDYTLRCLASIAAHPPVSPFEVIVAEDASGDPDVPRLRAVVGTKLIEQPENLGFLHNANAAARSATGDFVFFLNNDTQVTDGWLDTLVALLQRRTDAGAAGSKLIFPDGRLQEAGGIIWEDGSGWNYGRLDHPGRPRYSYIREVDYVSGAALMVRRSLFEALGGFDAHFAPAYCEDSDLAFRIRASGYKVLYQPRSVVVHFEGVSHGTDITQGVKAHQAINQRRFAERWRAELTKSHFPSATHIMRARDHARNRRMVLVIDHYVPQPDRDAGSRTMRAFMAALLESGSVVKFWPDNGAHPAGYTEALQDMGVEVLCGSDGGSLDDWLVENGSAVDVALLSRPDVADRAIAPLRLHTKATLVYYGHDLHFARMRQQAQATGDDALLAGMRAMEALERSVWRRTEIVLYPSEEETDVVRNLEPSVIARTIVPYAFESFGARRAAPHNTDILFVAGFAHPPNEDGAVWFASRVLPLVLRVVPTARLFIVGSNPTASVRDLAGGAISLHANVSDAELQAFYATARVTVVPLRFGAGVKLKVAEALREGVPLVTTPVGAQGCPGLGDVTAVCADEAAFAAAVCVLLADDKAWVAANARQVTYAAQRFSREAMAEAVTLAFGFGDAALCSG